jgi:hypothetical protein
MDTGEGSTTMLSCTGVHFAPQHDGDPVSRILVDRIGDQRRNEGFAEIPVSQWNVQKKAMRKEYADLSLNIDEASYSDEE